MKRRSILKSSKISVPQLTDTNLGQNCGKFTFCNGDTYEGEYKFQSEQFLLMKQGSGVYTTDDFNVYEGKWDNDNIAANTEMSIRYNDGAQFRGEIDVDGKMHGPGVYIFPDGSSIEATCWLDNKPSENIVYKEPLGFAWTVENVSPNMLSFSAGNHFWNDMLEASSGLNVTHSADAAEN